MTSPVSTCCASTVHSRSAEDHVGADHPQPEPDLVLDATFARGVADVVEDRRAVGDRLAIGPRPEPIAEGVHVGVGPDTRVGEQAPGAAELVPRLEDRVGLAREVRVELMAGADAGQAGTDDQEVDVLDRHPDIIPPMREAPPMLHRRGRS